MERRLTSMLRRSPARALALALAVAAAMPDRARGQLPDMPNFPAPAQPGPVEPQPEPKAPAEPPPAAAPEPARPAAPAAPTFSVSRGTDTNVRRTADPAGDGDPLPPAHSRPGAPAATAGARSDDPGSGYDLQPERIPPGRQAIGLTAEVVAPEIMNVGQVKTIKIVVKNTGVADAAGVQVHYTLPSHLQLVSAQPESKALADEPGRLNWGPFLIAAGSDRIIALKVNPTGIGTVDHTATVTLKVGARSHSTIQQPMLKVEQVVTPAQVLKGQPVDFRITVRNPGTGPARDVTIQARLSSGLKSNGDEVVEQTIPVIRPGESVQLDPLIVDTIAGGRQTCTVAAFSDDVASKDARAESGVEVLYPDLEVKLQGHQDRYTDTTADYTVIVENKGTAAARNVRVSVLLPAGGGGLVKPLPPEAEWNKSTQKLTWTIPLVEPASRDTHEPGRATGTLHVRLNGIGLYRVVAEARSADLFAKGNISTNVSGMADIDLDVRERKRILDMGETTIFDITMKNLGTKAAKNLLVTAVMTNVDVEKVAGIDSNAEAVFNDKSGLLTFPAIDSLAPGRELNLSIRVKAIKPGAATCRVKVVHEDIKDTEAGLEAVAAARVTPNSRTLK